MSYKKKHNISKSAISSIQVVILITNMIFIKPPKVNVATELNQKKFQSKMGKPNVTIFF